MLTLIGSSTIVRPDINYNKLVLSSHYVKRVQQ